MSKTTENFRTAGLQAQKWTRELPNMQECCPRRTVGVTNNTRTLWKLISLSTGHRVLCLGRTSLGSPATLRTALFSDSYRSRNAAYEARVGECASANSRSSTKKVHSVVKVQQYGFGHFTHLTTSHYLKANKTTGLNHIPIRVLFLKFNFQIFLQCIPLL
jgi:hypothetical protein